MANTDPVLSNNARNPAGRSAPQVVKWTDFFKKEISEEAIYGIKSDRDHGASAGIGAETACQLSTRGDKVVLAARLPAECGSGVLAVVLDLTDEDFDLIMSVNVKSALYGMQAIIPHFKERTAGHLINVSSFLWKFSFASYHSVYCAAKAALNSLTANVRMDLLADYPGIQVSVVMPPRVFSGFVNNSLYGGMPLAVGGFDTNLTAQTPAQVAAAIVELSDHLRAEMLTNPAQAEAVLSCYAEINAVEGNMCSRS